MISDVSEQKILRNLGQFRSVSVASEISVSSEISGCEDKWAKFSLKHVMFSKVGGGGGGEGILSIGKNKFPTLLKE
jgi:hypothetical protein